MQDIVIKSWSIVWLHICVLLQNMRQCMMNIFVSLLQVQSWIVSLNTMPAVSVSSRVQKLSLLLRKNTTSKHHFQMLLCTSTAQLQIKRLKRYTHLCLMTRSFQVDLLAGLQYNEYVIPHLPLFSYYWTIVHVHSVVVYTSAVIITQSRRLYSISRLNMTPSSVVDGKKRLCVFKSCQV
jgi:hypothetical protein